MGHHAHEGWSGGREEVGAFPICEAAGARSHRRNPYLPHVAAVRVTGCQGKVVLAQPFVAGYLSGACGDSCQA